MSELIKANDLWCVYVHLNIWTETVRCDKLFSHWLVAAVKEAASKMCCTCFSVKLVVCMWVIILIVELVAVDQVVCCVFTCWVFNLCQVSPVRITCVVVRITRVVVGKFADVVEMYLFTAVCVSVCLSVCVMMMMMMMMGVSGTCYYSILLSRWTWAILFYCFMWESHTVAETDDVFRESATFVFVMSCIVHLLITPTTVTCYLFSDDWPLTYSHSLLTFLQ